MPLIFRRMVVSFALKNMTQVTPTIRAHDLRPHHTERVVRMSSNRAGDVIEVRRPSATRLELLVGCVKGSVAGGTSVDARLSEVLVVFARASVFCALLPQDAELLW